MRGAAGLALAVLIAEEISVEHSFWVILGTLSVLRSNALNTGQNALRAVVGTLVGFIIGAGVVELVGTNVTLLWFLLPVVLLIAGFAPTAISFAAGQAGFTLTLVILFNILEPAGWRVGLVRLEDVAIGTAVSAGVALLLWPRGAAAELGAALHDAYTTSVDFLVKATSSEERPSARPLALQPSDDRERAEAASRRLDDAFRTYLVERGSKPVPLSNVSMLVTGVTMLHFAAYAVSDSGFTQRTTRSSGASRASTSTTPPSRSPNGTTSSRAASRARTPQRSSRLSRVTTARLSAPSADSWQARRSRTSKRPCGSSGPPITLPSPSASKPA